MMCLQYILLIYKLTVDIAHFTLWRESLTLEESDPTNSYNDVLQRLKNKYYRTEK
jgi:hypothetical protein